MVHGCVCDFPWTGYDCSHRECPRGDDPLTTGQEDAVQLVECNTTFRKQWLKLFSDSGQMRGGSFALRYGGEYTRPMPHNATAETLRARLRALDGVTDDDGDDAVGREQRRGPSGGGVRVAVTDSGADGEFVLRAWNLTFSDLADQAPLVPLYKQPEVQEAECAADRGFFTLRFPAPEPTGSAFSGICLGGPKAGNDCAHSDDCVGGLRTGEGSKCGPKTWEEVQLKFDATQAETVKALQSFSLIDRVRVNFSDIGPTADNNRGGYGLGGGKFCTPGGNTVTVEFLSTRLDVRNHGDVPQLVAIAGPSLKRQSTSVADLEGSVVLTQTFREVVKGVDSCSREEAQAVSCLASGGSFTVALPSSLATPTGDDDDADDGSGGSGRSEAGDDDGAITDSATTTVTLAFDATAREVKAALETLPLVENVTVVYAGNRREDGTFHLGGSFCGAGSAAHEVTVTFHALHEGFAHRLARLPGRGGRGGAGGDVPALAFDGSGLTHDSGAALPATATEVVKGLACEPLGDTFVVGSRDDDRVASAYVAEQPAQMASGVVHANQDGGHFALGFLGEATEPISASASAAEVTAALNALPTLRGNVAVSFSRQHACQSPANVMAVTFLGDFGVGAAAFRAGAVGRANRASLPPLSVDRHAMPSSFGGGVNGTWAAPRITVHTDGASDSTGTFFSRNATKESAVCSNHGVCQERLGVCDCFTTSDFGYDHAFSSSDGAGKAGARGDCGFEASPRGDPRDEWQVAGRGGGPTVKSAFSQAKQMVHEQSWGVKFPTTDCPGPVACSGHGHCSGPPSFTCACAVGWQQAPDCSERQCPRAPAWFDYPTERNRAHDKRGGGVECAGRGHCDRDAGECVCQAGFTGDACQFTQCPGRVLSMAAPGKIGSGALGHRVGGGGNGGVTECSGHGRCLDMGQLALLSATDRGNAAGLSYGADPNNPFTWDGKRVRGCSCDAGWTGADCGEQTCPFGDDPNTHDDVAEVQLLNCTATGGSFTLSFRSVVDSGSGTRVPATTEPLAHNASAAEVKAALEALDTVEEVVVKYSSESTHAFCLGGRDWENTPASSREVNIVSVRFVREGGDLPPLTADASLLTDAPFGDDAAVGGGSGVVHVASGGAEMHGVRSVAGSREHRECSGRGVCDRSTGICDCFPGYASGDGGNANARGVRGDCGYLVGDRLLRAVRGRGDSDPGRAHGLEDAGREGGSSGHGGHGLGGAYANAELPGFEDAASAARQARLRAAGDSGRGATSSAAVTAAASAVPGDGEENLPSSAQEVLAHVAQAVAGAHHHRSLLERAGRRLLALAFGQDSPLGEDEEFM